MDKRTCATCEAPLTKRPGPGRWPKYCPEHGQQRSPFADIAVKDCVGCGAELPPRSYRGNPRKWCSGSCRVKTIGESSPAYRERKAELAATRHRETYVPVRHACTCAVCGEGFESRTKIARYCSDRCRYRQHYLGRRARKYGAARESYTVEQVGERDGWVCGLCAEAVDAALAYPNPEAPSVDHDTPLSLGGTDTLDNVQIAHLGCNWRKGNRAA